MLTTLSQILLLIQKDLRIESRRRDTIGLVIVLALLIVVVLSLGLGPQQLTKNGAALTSLWVAYLFSGVLCFEKTMSIERRDAAMAGLLLAPLDRAAIYFAKLFTNLILIFSLSLIITPAAIILFNFDLPNPLSHCLLIFALSILGFAAIGTLFAAATSSSKLQGGFLSIIIFPICLPLVITSSQLLIKLAPNSTTTTAPADSLPSSGLSILLAFDAIYLTLSWLIFELILEP